jgi:alkaline phosphatase D
MDGETYVEQLGPFAATPGDAGFTHVPVTDLVAGARYRYAFFEMAEGVRTGRSRNGRLRAPIASDASELLTFGAICCTDKGRSPDPIQRAADEPNLDAFLLLGDNSYCVATDLAKFRLDYRDHYGRPAHVALRANHGQYITWDDHEIENNWDPETLAGQQVADAFSAFFEHAPLRRDQTSPNQIWRSARWGKTVEVFVLDCRSERLPSTRSGANAQYISPAQLAWLKQGLMSSTATFKLILNSVPITNMPGVWDFQQTDRWEGYAAQRTDLLTFIDANVQGVVWLAGDFHLAFISKVSPSGPGANQREVLCGPGGQSPNALVPTLTAPQFSFATGTNNFTTLKLDPGAREVTVTYTNGAGEQFHSESFVV